MSPGFGTWRTVSESVTSESVGLRVNQETPSSTRRNFSVTVAVCAAGGAVIVKVKRPTAPGAVGASFDDGHQGGHGIQPG